MPFITPDEAARLEQLEATCAHFSKAWGGLEEIRLYLWHTCHRGTVIKGADAAELYLAVEDVMKAIDEGWLMVRAERAKGTKTEVHALFAPLFGE
jgi:hypothetical protein